jgi:hypothetical protein
MMRCLFVRPQLSAEQNGGDEVVYRKILTRLQQTMDVDVLELEPVGKLKKLVGILGGAPPECTRYISRHNAKLLEAQLRSADYQVALFNNEVTFPVAPVAGRMGVRRVQMAHNVHSLIARTDPSALGRMMLPFALAFERRLYADPDIELICISKADVHGLQLAGVRPKSLWLAPPGAPPAEALSPAARLTAEIVLTGSYAWWRKRRDLAAFAADPSPGLPILVSDPAAAQTLGALSRLVDPSQVDWAGGIRLGLITDRFVGGFKLKSVEYVARNCVVLSYCDIDAEFEGLPHSAKFVRRIRTANDIGQVLRELGELPGDQLAAEFAAFKAACLERYDWRRCLDPIVAAVQGDLAAERFAF